MEYLVGLELGHPLPSDTEHSVPQLRMMLREAETILGREAPLVEWCHL